MSGLSASAVVVISIAAAAFVVALCAAMWKYHGYRSTRPRDTEIGDGMLPHASPGQQTYMRDVRMRNQLQAWGYAPTYEGTYQPPKSHVGASSVGGGTNTSYGMG